jgi:hypothetical protein
MTKQAPRGFVAILREVAAQKESTAGTCIECRTMKIVKSLKTTYAMYLEDHATQLTRMMEQASATSTMIALRCTLLACLLLQNLKRMPFDMCTRNSVLGVKFKRFHFPAKVELEKTWETTVI